MIIIIVVVVVGVFIFIVCLIFIIKCVVRNKLIKDDYMYVRGRGKLVYVWVIDYVRYLLLIGYFLLWLILDGIILYIFICEVGVKNNLSSLIKICIMLNNIWYFIL